ncbi:hypothetical protein EV2_035910 [Malus domestica]
MDVTFSEHEMFFLPDHTYYNIQGEMSAEDYSWIDLPTDCGREICSGGICQPHASDCREQPINIAKPNVISQDPTMGLSNYRE